MTGETVSMSSKELKRVEILERLSAKQLNQVEAAAHLGLSTRQVRRLQEKYRRKGARGLVSKRRGKPSNNRLTDAIKQEALSWIEGRYKDFGPTLAHEKLTEPQLWISFRGVSLNLPKLADGLFGFKQ